MLQDCFKNLVIEPTNICNLHCPLCPAGNDYFKKESQGIMTFEQFKNIIDSIKDFVVSIFFLGFGEPFLAPDIMKMIDYAGKNGIAIKIHTNGIILNKKIMNQFLKNYKLQISFSIDGITQKSYSYYRKGGVLKKALDNLSYLADLKRKYNLFNLKIIWQFLIMRINEDEIPIARQLADEIGVDKLRLKTIRINSRKRYFLPKNPKYRRKINKLRNNKECEFIDSGSPSVLWDGNVVPCCNYDVRECIMGNVFQKNILTIWHSKKYEKFRKDYQQQKNILCNKCKLKRAFKIYFKEFNFNR